jgi:hypothetical protein
VPYKGQKPCKCRSHHRPHLHAPCAIDLNAKTAAVSGAMKIVRREVAAKRNGTTETTAAVRDATQIPSLTQHSLGAFSLAAGDALRGHKLLCCSRFRRASAGADARGKLRRGTSRGELGRGGLRGTLSRGSPSRGSVSTQLGQTPY